MDSKRGSYKKKKKKKKTHLYAKKVNGFSCSNMLEFWMTEKANRANSDPFSPASASKAIGINTLD
jgi:hypothetical protein